MSARISSGRFLSDKQLDAIVANSLLPLAIALFATALLHMQELQLTSWGEYFSALLRLAIELSPVFLCKFFSVNNSGIKKLAWWLAGFVLLPVSVILAAGAFTGFGYQLLSTYQTWLMLLMIELAALINYALAQKRVKGIKFKASLDNVLLIIILALSLAWALLLASHHDPLNNQPIPLVLDVKRIVSYPLALLSYWLQTVILYTCLYVIYLVNHHLLVKRILSQYGVYAYLTLTGLLLLVCYPLLAQIALWLPMNDVVHPLNASGNQNPFDFWNIYIATLVVGISLPVIMAFQLQKDHRKLAELQQEKLQTELKWLQQQINPHFLFNTLNNLYALCLSKSPRAPDAILQLANLLRFVVYKGSCDRVSLSEEIAYLHDYLALQKLRVENKCHFEIHLPDEAETGALMISPLLLVMFLENAFKHGIEPSAEKSRLQVSLTVQTRRLVFSCQNTIPQSSQSHDHRPGMAQGENDFQGIGLKNVQRRLALMYPEAHQLAVSTQAQETGKTYSVELSLVLEAKVYDAGGAPGKPVMSRQVTEKS
ncbi:sensor histidine kinase [Thalassomonas actiniarum]|uniref:Histidine kinase n=1 Tax=Thalassomonas actiniarum TaxID=485447 RepID=A0AAE9YXN9_9GAMM|nr:histidine kinase [Thalassomonas actiniarum]WDE02330.1 histidine kinase [Thalassomonas actiniarum]